MSTTLQTVDSFHDVAGARLHVQRTGVGDPLVLITGLGADISSWAKLTALLDGREVVTFDQPGMGRSTLTPRPMRMKGTARVALALLDELGLERFDLLGYSLGGILAQEIAFRAPRRVRKLVLAGTTPGIPCELAPLKTRRMLMDRKRFDDRELAERTLPLLAGGVTARDPELVAELVAKRMADPPDRRAFRRQVWSVLGWSGQRRLRKLEIPLLVLHAEEDPLIPRSNADKFAELVPDARLHVLPGAGHLFLWDEPESAAPLIKEFLDS